MIPLSIACMFPLDFSIVYPLFRPQYFYFLNLILYILPLIRCYFGIVLKLPFRSLSLKSSQFLFFRRFSSFFNSCSLLYNSFPLITRSQLDFSSSLSVFTLYSCTFSLPLYPYIPPLQQQPCPPPLSPRCSSSPLSPPYLPRKTPLDRQRIIAATLAEGNRL